MLLVVKGSFRGKVSRPLLAVLDMVAVALSERKPSPVTCFVLVELEVDIIGEQVTSVWQTPPMVKFSGHMRQAMKEVKPGVHLLLALRYLEVGTIVG